MKMKKAYRIKLILTSLVIFPIQLLAEELTQDMTLTVEKLLLKSDEFQIGFITGIVESTMVEVNDKGEFVKDYACLRNWLKEHALKDFSDKLDADQKKWSASASVLISSYKACPNIN